MRNPPSGRIPPSRLNRLRYQGNQVWKRRRKLRNETGVMVPRSEIRESSLASFSMSSLMTSFRASSCSCCVVLAAQLLRPWKILCASGAVN